MVPGYATDNNRKIFTSWNHGIFHKYYAILFSFSYRLPSYIYYGWRYYVLNIWIAKKFQEIKNSFPLFLHFAFYKSFQIIKKKKRKKLWKKKTNLILQESFFYMPKTLRRNFCIISSWKEKDRSNPFPFFRHFFLLFQFDPKPNIKKLKKKKT